VTPFGPGEPGEDQITNGFKVQDMGTFDHYPFLTLEVISICGPVTLRNIRTPQQILLPTKGHSRPISCVQYSLVPRPHGPETRLCAVWSTQGAITSCV